MALTLIEAAKLSTDPIERAVINEFAAGEILGRIPFANEEGSGVHYNRVDELPAVGFRALNEAYDEEVTIDVQYHKICISMTSTIATILQIVW